MEARRYFTQTGKTLQEINTHLAYQTNRNRLNARAQYTTKKREVFAKIYQDYLTICTNHGIQIKTFNQLLGNSTTANQLKCIIFDSMI